MGGINAKQAADSAAAYYKEVTGDYNQTSVAEIEKDESDNWVVTLMHKGQSATNPFSSFNDQWLFKTFVINSNTGDVLSMKVKKI